MEDSKERNEINELIELLRNISNAHEFIRESNKLIDTLEEIQNSKFNSFHMLDGKLVSFIDLTILQNLSGNLFISMLNTCQTHAAVKESIENLQDEIHVLKKLSRLKLLTPGLIDPELLLAMNGLSNRLRKNLMKYNPLTILNIISPKNTNICMNFVGKGDWDFDDINTDVDANLFVQFLEDTSLNPMTAFSLVSDGSNSITLPSFFDNGSIHGKRHILGQEKTITRNLMKLFAPFVKSIELDETTTSKLANILDANNVPLLLPLDYSSRVICDIIASYFPSVSEHILTKAINDTILIMAGSFSYDNHNEIITQILSEINVQITKLPNDISSFMNVSYETLRNNEQMHDNEFGPVHYIQSLFTAIMMSTLNQPSEIREIIAGNIIVFINSLTSRQFQIPIDLSSSPINTLIGHLILGSNIEIDMGEIQNVASNIFSILQAAQHVTQLEFLNLISNDRTLVDGFHAANGSFCVPLFTIINILSENLLSEMPEVISKTPKLSNYTQEDLQSLNLFDLVELKKKKTFRVFNLFKILTKEHFDLLSESDMKIIAPFSNLFVEEQIPFIPIKLLEIIFDTLALSMISYFTNDQLEIIYDKLTNEEISYLTEEHIQWLAPYKIIAKLNFFHKIQIRYFTHDQLIEIVPNFNYKQIRNLSNEQLTHDVLKLFDPEKIDNLSCEQIQFLDNERIMIILPLLEHGIKNLTNEQLVPILTQLSAIQLSKLSFGQINKLDDEQIAKILLKLTPEQIGFISRDVVCSFDENLLIKLNDAQIDAFFEINNSYNNRIYIFELFDSRQFNALLPKLKPEHIKLLGRAQIELIDDDKLYKVLPHFNDTQINFLGLNRIRSLETHLSVQILSRFSKSQIQWLTSQQIEILPDEAFNFVISSLYAEQFSINKIKSLTHDQLILLNNITGFSNKQIQKFSGEQLVDILPKLKHWQIDYLTIQQLDIVLPSLDENQMEYLSYEQIILIEPEKIANVISKFKKYHPLIFLTNTQLSFVLQKLTREQIGYLSYEQINLLSDENFKVIAPYINQDAIRHLCHDKLIIALPFFNENQIHSIHNRELQSFNNEQIDVIAEHLDCDQIANLYEWQFKFALSKFTDVQLKFANSEQLNSLDDEQLISCIHHICPNIIPYLNDNKFKLLLPYFNENEISHFSSKQIKLLNDEQFSSFLSNFNDYEIYQLSYKKIQSLADDQLLIIIHYVCATNLSTKQLNSKVTVDNKETTFFELLTDKQFEVLNQVQFLSIPINLIIKKSRSFGGNAINRLGIDRFNAIFRDLTPKQIQTISFRCRCYNLEINSDHLNVLLPNTLPKQINEMRYEALCYVDISVFSKLTAEQIQGFNEQHIENFDAAHIAVILPHLSKEQFRYIKPCTLLKLVNKITNKEIKHMSRIQFSYELLMSLTEKQIKNISKKKLAKFSSVQLSIIIKFIPQKIINDLLYDLIGPILHLLTQKQIASIPLKIRKDITDYKTFEYMYTLPSIIIFHVKSEYIKKMDHGLLLIMLNKLSNKKLNLVQKVLFPDIQEDIKEQYINLLTNKDVLSEVLDGKHTNIPYAILVPLLQRGLIYNPDNFLSAYHKLRSPFANPLESNSVAKSKMIQTSVVDLIIPISKIIVFSGTFARVPDLCSRIFKEICTGHLNTHLFDNPEAAIMLLAGFIFSQPGEEAKATIELFTCNQSDLCSPVKKFLMDEILPIVEEYSYFNCDLKYKLKTLSNQWSELQIQNLRFGSQLNKQQQI